MNNRNGIDQELETLFEGARMAPPQVPEGLMVRVLSDADALQKASRGGWFFSFFKVLGGAPGMGGLITATCVGFWLGVAPPEGLPDLAGNVLGLDGIVVADASSDVLGGSGWNFEESEQDG